MEDKRIIDEIVLQLSNFRFSRYSMAYQYLIDAIYIVVKDRNTMRDLKDYVYLPIAKRYNTRDKKFGIEIERQKGDRLIIDKVDNLTESNEKINKLLETIVESTQNFTLLESFAYDFADDMSLSYNS